MRGLSFLIAMFWSLISGVTSAGDRVNYTFNFSTGLNNDGTLHSKPLDSIGLPITSPLLDQAIKPKNLRPLKLPRVREFSDELDEKTVGNIGQWMQDRESDFLLHDNEFVVAGEFGRLVLLENKQTETFQHFVFRSAYKNAGRTVRTISLFQSLDANPNINFLTGAVTDASFEVDTLIDGNQGYLSSRKAKMSQSDASTVLALTGYRPTFHPLRAAVCSTSQTLDGGALEIGEHSVLKKVLKKTAIVGDVTFAWLDIGGPQASTRRIVAFKNGCPVQSDNWFKIDEKSNRPVPYDSVYTEWDDTGGVKVPVAMMGVRNHRNTPSEFKFTIAWKFKDVNPNLFDPTTLGTLSLELGGGRLKTD